MQKPIYIITLPSSEKSSLRRFGLNLRTYLRLKQRTGKSSVITPLPLGKCGLANIGYSIEVDETSRKVTIVAVGHKEHNALFVKGREVKI